MTPSEAVAAWEEGDLGAELAVAAILPEILDCNRRIAALEAQRASYRSHVERIMREANLPPLTLEGHVVAIREASRWQVYDRKALNALAQADPRMAPAILSCLVWQERAGGLEIRRDGK